MLILKRLLWSLQAPEIRHILGQHKIGPAASRIAAQGLESERLEDHRAIARANGDKLLADPVLALDAITHGQATFIARDLAKFVHRHSDGKEQFDQVLSAVRASPQLVKLGRDGPFADLKLRPAQPLGPTQSPFDRAVERVARAVADIMRLRRQGFDELPHQRVALDAAARELEALRPDGRRDVDAVFRADPSLVDDAAKGRTAAVIRAMALEAERRTDRTVRADRFVADWNAQARRAASLDKAGEGWRADDVRQTMATMARSLERDPQLESLLRNRVKELGIRPTSGASLSHDLQRWLGLSRGRGIGI